MLVLANICFSINAKRYKKTGYNSEYEINPLADSDLRR